MIGENKQLSIGKVRKLEIDNSGKKSVHNSSWITMDVPSLKSAKLMEHLKKLKQSAILTERQFKFISSQYHREWQTKTT